MMRCWPMHSFVVEGMIKGWMGWKCLDKEIRGKDKQILITDIRGVPILRSSMAPYMAPKGKSVYLTIDQNIQYFAERALDRAMGTTQAQSGLIIVMDPKTGAILAMASRPTYDPNNFNKAEPAQFRNKAVVDIYELVLLLADCSGYRPVGRYI